MNNRFRTNLIISLILIFTSIIGCKKEAKKMYAEKVNYTRDFIDRYRPTTFRPMKFGVYINRASYLYIRNYTTKQIIEEIELYENLGIDVFRFDIRYDLWMDGDQKSITNLETAINKVHSIGKQLWLSIYGVEAWNGATLEDYGKASWEDWKSMMLEETQMVITNYQPDYILILPEAPSLMQNQIKTEITTGDWVAFAGYLSSVVKSISPNTIIVTEVALQIDNSRIESRTYFKEIMQGTNDIDVIGVDPYSLYELETYTDSYALPYTNPAKELWIGETWDNGNIEYRGELSALYVKAAVYYSQSVGMDGFMLFPGGWGLHNSELEPSSVFYSYKKVIDEVRNHL